MLLALLLVEARLPSAEYDRVRAAENAKIEAQRRARSASVKDPAHAKLVKAAEEAVENYRKVFREVEKAHPGYVLQPERLVLVKLE